MTKQDAVFHLSRIRQAPLDHELVANIDTETVYAYAANPCRILLAPEISIGTVQDWLDAMDDAEIGDTDYELFKTMLEGAKDLIDDQIYMDRMESWL